MQCQVNYKMYYGPAGTDLEGIADRIEPCLKNLPDAEYHKVLRILAYRNPWRPTHGGWINVLDQCLHFFYAAGVFLPILLSPSYLTAALSGLVLGAIREWEQWKELDLKILMFWDRLQDAAFFALGGLCLYGFITLCCG